MNKQVLKGRRWLFFACTLIASPVLWRIGKYLLYALTTDAYHAPIYHNALISELPITAFLLIAFFLTYRGQLWAKWLLVILCFVNFVAMAISLIDILSFDVFRAYDRGMLFFQFGLVVIFSYLPALILIFSAPLNAFLRYRNRLAYGDKLSMEDKLDQIGSDQ
ncbi:MAG: hypothetical protein AAF927_06965 [Bacteroidota bacterium]